LNLSCDNNRDYGNRKNEARCIPLCISRVYKVPALIITFNYSIVRIERRSCSFTGNCVSWCTIGLPVSEKSFSNRIFSTDSFAYDNASVQSSLIGPIGVKTPSEDTRAYANDFDKQNR